MIGKKQKRMKNSKKQKRVFLVFVQNYHYHFLRNMPATTSNLCGVLFLYHRLLSDKLTPSHLKVKKVQPVRCGPFRLFCFGSSYVSKNIDLSKVDDVDVMGIPAPCCHRTCCCSSGKDLIEVESRFESRGQGKIFLVLEEGHGESVANMILNQVEESQKMERGL